MMDIEILAKRNSHQAEVLEAENEFKAANPDGVISKEKFILSMEVIIISVWWFASCVV